MRSASQDLIVIGASAGGIEPLCGVLSSLPPDFPAAVFVVMHIPAWRDSFLPAILSRCCRLPTIHPLETQTLKHGRVYVAPPDHHLVLEPDEQIKLSHGPKENNFRPSINVLFRSAAVAYGPRVAGVVLSGALDDGTTGLWWIKRMGGKAVVQQPADARFRQMPDAALAHVAADYVAPASEIGHILTDLANGNRRPVTGPHEGLAQ